MELSFVGATGPQSP